MLEAIKRSEARQKVLKEQELVRIEQKRQQSIQKQEYQRSIVEH